MGFYFISEEVAKQNKSMFMAGYALEISTLTAILNENDDGNRAEIAKSELCEDIEILESKIEEGSFNIDYFEIIVSKTISKYQVKIKELGAMHCAKNT